MECTFGIMKGIFCVLRNGLHFYKIDTCDQVWLTCCTLHNRLLFVDGLHKHWDMGEMSNWEKIYNKCNQISIPFSLQRLHTNPTHAMGLIKCVQNKKSI